MKDKIVILNLIALFFGYINFGYSQNLDQAKKAIDAEQYEKAKTILKKLIAIKADDGKNYFFLGNIYLRLQEPDSALIYYNKGISVKIDGNWNYIGLGEIDLNNNNVAAAKTKFDLAIKDIKKRDYLEFLYIGKAFANATTPHYVEAVEYLNRAKKIKTKDAELEIALGDVAHKEHKNNDAYMAYRDALEIDHDALRAELQMAVITKNAKAFQEAVTLFDQIAVKHPNYGPVYRELAETYYLWANSAKTKYAEYTKKALEYYKKYMSLTDYSLESRMRHADFLILTKEYKALEEEANSMVSSGDVNPKIYRYLGYSSYENGHCDESIKALGDFMSKVEPSRLIARDYLYLALAKIAKANKEEGVIDDHILFQEAIEDINKAVEKNIDITNELNSVGLKLFKQRFYSEAVKIFEIAISNEKSNNYIYDNFYLGYALYFYYASQNDGTDTQPDIELLNAAEAAFGRVVEISPKAQDAYLYRARTNSIIDTKESKVVMIDSYESYVKIVTEKGDAEVEKSKKNLIEAYSNIAAFYLESNREKAIENLDKILLLDEDNQFAIDNLKKLKK